MIATLFRFLRMADARKTCPAYELDGAAFVLYHRIWAARIGASMDRLAGGLR